MVCDLQIRRSRYDLHNLFRPFLGRNRHSALCGYVLICLSVIIVLGCGDDTPVQQGPVVSPSSATIVNNPGSGSFFQLVTATEDTIEYFAEFNETGYPERLLAETIHTQTDGWFEFYFNEDGEIVKYNSESYGRAYYDDNGQVVFITSFGDSVIQVPVRHSDLFALSRPQSSLNNCDKQENDVTITVSSCDLPNQDFLIAGHDIWLEVYSDWWPTAPGYRNYRAIEQSTGIYTVDLPGICNTIACDPEARAEELCSIYQEWISAACAAGAAGILEIACVRYGVCIPPSIGQYICSLPDEVQEWLCQAVHVVGFNLLGHPMTIRAVDRTTGVVSQWYYVDNVGTIPTINIMTGPMMDSESMPVISNGYAVNDPYIVSYGVYCLPANSDVTLTLEPVSTGDPIVFAHNFSADDAYELFMEYPSLDQRQRLGSRFQAVVTVSFRDDMGIMHQRTWSRELELLETELYYVRMNVDGEDYYMNQGFATYVLGWVADSEDGHASGGMSINSVNMDNPVSIIIQIGDNIVADPYWASMQFPLQSTSTMYFIIYVNYYSEYFVELPSTDNMSVLVTQRNLIYSHEEYTGELTGTVSGTFECTAHNESGNIINVTNGEFNLPIHENYGLIYRQWWEEYH